MLEVVLALGVPLLIGSTGFWLAIHENHKRVDRWDEAATLLEFEVTDRSRSYWGLVYLEARKGAVTIRIANAGRNRRHAPTRIVLSAQGPPGSAGLRVRRESTFQPGAREVEIGDGVFDATFSIEGPARVVAVLLDAQVRDLLTRLNLACSRVGIIGHEIVVELFDGMIPDVLPLLLDIGEGFIRKLDEPRKHLADNARQDPEPGVRVFNLRLLARDFPGEPETGEALRSACADPSPQVRLQAGKSLRAEGRDVLLDLAERLVDDECSAQAVAALGEGLPSERAQEVLRAALRWRRLQTARACVERLGRSGGAAAVDVLARVLAREEGEVAVAAALALGEIG
ncbi:MAG: hypothetical protein ABUT39_04675, partial [Acidobacteriota bacterium]